MEADSNERVHAKFTTGTPAQIWPRPDYYCDFGITYFFISGLSRSKSFTPVTEPRDGPSTRADGWRTARATSVSDPRPCPHAQDNALRQQPGGNGTAPSTPAVELAAKTTRLSASKTPREPQCPYPRSRARSATLLSPHVHSARCVYRMGPRGPYTQAHASRRRTRSGELRQQHVAGVRRMARVLPCHGSWRPGSPSLRSARARRRIRARRPLCSDAACERPGAPLEAQPGWPA